MDHSVSNPWIARRSRASVASVSGTRAACPEPHIVRPDLILCGLGCLFGSRNGEAAKPLKWCSWGQPVLLHGGRTCEKLAEDLIR